MASENKIFILNRDEVSRLSHGLHDEPHHILGLHECLGDVYINVFIPGAAKVQAVAVPGGKSYELEQLYEDGFYSVKITNCKPFDYKLKIYGYDGSLIEETGDSYAFPYSIEPEKILAMAGASDEKLRLYECLGARCKTINGTKGVAFCMNMPGAIRVSVIGDFNNWDGRRHPMRRIDYTDIFELFVPGEHLGARYKFEAVYENGHRDIFTDPYAAQYEKDGDAAVLADTSYSWKDKRWMTARKDNTAVNIYEVCLPAWKKNEAGSNLNYKEFGEQLSEYVADMGYNYVELMPLMEYRDDYSWGYDTYGSYAPTSRFGAPQDFMAMVDKLHSKKIGVIMDMVPVQDAEVVAYWLDTYHLDGIRLDNREIIENIQNRLAEQYPDVLFNVNFHREAVASLEAYMQTPPARRGSFKDFLKGFDREDGASADVIALSHDEVAYDKGGFIGRLQGGYEDRFADLRILYALAMTLPGKKLMFMGQEMGLASGFDGVNELDWNVMEFDANKFIKKYVQDLNKLYLNEPALQKSDAKVSFTEKQQRVTEYVRCTGENADKLYIICNFDIKKISDYELQVEKTGSYKEIFSSDNSIYGGEGDNNRQEKQAGEDGIINIVLPALSVTIVKAV